MNPYTSRRRATPDQAALDVFNDGVKRARDAYHNTPATGLTYQCACGKRTQSDKGICQRCQEENQ